MTACASDSLLAEICSRIGVEVGDTDQQTCQYIVRKVRQKKRCLKKADLQEIARYFGVSDKGTVDQLLETLEDAGKDGVEIDEVIDDMDTPMDAEEEEKIVKTSVSKKVVGMETLSCITYIARYMIMVPVPKNMFNHQKRWLPTEGVGPGYPECKNCAFYFSTGTSNEGKNFPGMWFPFLRIKETLKRNSYDQDRGWIHKAHNLSTANTLKQQLSKKFGIKMTPFLDVFLEKFSHWWQVSISAALPSAPDALWNIHPELIALRPIALSYDYYAYPDKGHDHLIANPGIVKIYDVPDCSRNLAQPEEVNAWLREYGALCSDRD
jgi:hypothetical protein